MSFLRTLALAVGFILSLFFFIPISIENPKSDKLKIQFDEFLTRFNKTYNETIYQHRFNAFQQSLSAINKMNSQRKDNSSALYGLTQFSDMTQDEFLDKHLQSDLYDRMLSRNSKEHEDSAERNEHRIKRKISGLPDKVDWRNRGVITEVNSQKLCGACWAFSTIENMEAMYAIKTGKLIPLSVQQLIDCAGYNNEGCNGGDACTLLKWMTDYNVKVQTAEKYPLHLRNEDCKMKYNSSGVQVGKYACQRLVGNEKYILLTLANVGPVAVAINALTWQNYLGGVIQFHCGDSPQLLNHAVQIVGYDLSAEIPHYIVRNSWGEEFGDGGYLYIAIDSNVCGLANEVSVLRVL